MSWMNRLLMLLLAFQPVAAGSLQPPGPPAPTMKTLSEVKPGTPIHAADVPLVITIPGAYYLAEPITVMSGIPILIQADAVSLDLGGFTLESTSTTDELIRIDGPCESNGVSIANGRLRGGRHAISAAPPNPCSLTLERLSIAAPAEHGILVLNAGATRIVDGSVSSAGDHAILVSGGTPTPPVTIGGMHLDGQAGVVALTAVTARVAQTVIAPPNPCLIAVELNAGDGSRFENNSILFPPNPCLPAVQIIASIGVTLRGNTIRAGGGTDPASHGIYADPGSHDLSLSQNLISGFGGDGIRLEASGGTLRGNVTNRGNGNGIHVAGDDHLLEANRASWNSGAGIWFQNSSGHVYRDSMLTANVSGPVGGPGMPDATDAGGNIP